MDFNYFDTKYKRIGGLNKLIEMMDDCRTLKEISEYFGVSKERAKQWSHDILGLPYDPRKKRRRLKIDIIKDLINQHGEEVIRAGYNKELVQEAIKELNEKEWIN